MREGAAARNMVVLMHRLGDVLKFLANNVRLVKLNPFIFIHMFGFLYVSNSEIFCSISNKRLWPDDWELTRSTNADPIRYLFF